MSLVQAMWTLGLLRADELPASAAEALGAGIDSAALRMLAGLSASEIAEAPELLSRCFRELGIAVPTKADAARRIATSISKKILSGAEAPRAAAEKLWEVSLRVGDVTFHDLDAFIYAASEMQSRPEDADFFNREIVREAREWASKG